MPSIIISNFGGEIPRMPARALPAGAAQVNSNLLATATEFRPLAGDSTVAVANSGAKTLYRLSRSATGIYRTGDTTGWLAELADKNYVKGQLADDETERTYVSFNDGLTPMRVIDASGADRQLGVPAPTTVAAALAQGAYFSQTEANTWMTDTLIPAVQTAIKAAVYQNEPASRVALSLPIAGPYTLQGLTWTSGSDPKINMRLCRSVANATAADAGLKDPLIKAEVGATNTLIPISCLPFWGTVPSTTTFTSTMAAVRRPGDATTVVFTADWIAKIVTQLTDLFDPSSETIKPLRTELDNQVKAFNDALDFILSYTTITYSATVVLDATGKPTEPARPTVPEGYWSGSESADVTWIPETVYWPPYRIALENYNADMELWKRGKTTTAEEKAARIAAIVAAQAKALSLTTEIEKIFADRFASLDALVSDAITVNLNDLVKVDADRIIDSRFYFATYVTDWGEESAPGSVTAMLDVDQYSSVTITLTAETAVTTPRHITKWRIYRSNVGSQQTNFQFVSETVIGTLTYTDTLKGAQLGEVCPSVAWREPPKSGSKYLRGMVGMPNGVMAAFMDNYVTFCEPYLGYAWPVEYQIPLKFPVVGLGVFGQSLFVGTYANPSIISGSDSASMSEHVLDQAQACLSARSIVSVGGGVLYASPDGICFANDSGVEVITSGLFAREDWQALTPESIFAAMHEGVYYFWYSGTYGGATGGCLALDMVAKKLTRVADMTATAVFEDILTDAVFYVSGTSVKRAFSTGRRSANWKSGKVVLPAHAGFAWLQVDGDQSSGAPATITWYGDGVSRKVHSITGIDPVRLPAGRYLEHEIEITSAARITKVGIYGDTQELKNG